MVFTDKVLKCKECGADFVFTAGEQEFYSSKGFENEPSRCRDCRTARRRDRGDGRKMYKVTCAACGAETEVPFMPKEDRPVYCRSCFESRRG